MHAWGIVWLLSENEEEAKAQLLFISVHSCCFQDGKKLAIQSVTAQFCIILETPSFSLKKFLFQALPATCCSKTHFKAGLANGQDRKLAR